MKKLICLALAVLIMAMPAAAAFFRSPRAEARLSFSGTTAYCSATARADSTSDRVELYVELWEGDSMMDAWEESGYGYADWSYRFSATRGESYTLVVYASVNGSDFATEYETATCR